MDEIIKMLFIRIMHQEEGVDEIESVNELCEVIWDTKAMVNIFAAMNDDGDVNYDTDDILRIADKAYQEVRQSGKIA